MFIHEYGHYAIAKLCKVRVDIFSIGYGRELFGFHDRSGTRWRFSLIPAGGYVKLFGDVDATSAVDQDLLDSISEKDKKDTFYFKALYQKALIIIAGPGANFLLSIIILSFLYTMYGKPYTLPIIGNVVDGSVASAAGLEVGDRIISIDGETIQMFDDVLRIISINPGTETLLAYKRNDVISFTSLIPKVAQSRDVFGNVAQFSEIGISADTVDYRDMSIPSAVYSSIVEIKNIIRSTCKVLLQMITGKRGLNDLAGPIRIAKYSGQSMEKGIMFTFWFIAMLSINIGFVNLLPIAPLDGGHLFCYLIEAVSRKKFAMKYRDYSMKLGMVVLLMVFALTTFNDLKMLFL